MLERTLNKDMTTLSAYLQTWRLKLSDTKTVRAVFHLHDREAKRELKVKNNVNILPFFPVPTYLGVKLDSGLTYHHHLEALRKKLSTHVSLLRRLAGFKWSAGVKTLRTAALSLIHVIAEYCAQLGVAVRILASLTVFLTTLCALSLDAFVPLQPTTFQFSQASSQLSFAAKE